MTFWPQNKLATTFQDSSWNISVSRLAILAASVLRYREEKPRDTQTNGGKNHNPATVVGEGNEQEKKCSYELTRVACVVLISPYFRYYHYM